MTYIVESTESFETEFTRNHKDKKEWLIGIIDRLEQ